MVGDEAARFVIFLRRDGTGRARGIDQIEQRSLQLGEIARVRGFPLQRGKIEKFLTAFRGDGLGGGRGNNSARGFSTREGGLKIQHALQACGIRKDSVDGRRTKKRIKQRHLGNLEPFRAAPAVAYSRTPTAR